MHQTFALTLAAAATVLTAAPAAAQRRGDEPIAVPRTIKQGIDFVYVDPAMTGIRKKPRANNWLARMFSFDFQRSGAPNPWFEQLGQGLQQYRATWGRLPQTRIAVGAPLKPGARGARVAALRTRLGLNPSGGYDGALGARVSDYQRVHGLGKPDGVAGKATIASLNRGSRYYEARIAINMERAWRLPKTREYDRYVIVDSGGAETFLVARDRISDRMRVIVGSPKTKTPMMAVLMKNAKANPYWHVPPELAKSLTAQKVKEQGVGYFNAFHYEVMPDWSGAGVPLNPASINWTRVRTAKTLPTFMVRQKPGPWNSMGMMKFEMPNDFGIYFHDTPLKEKFNDPDRWISNGCIRLEDYRRFASWVFPRPPQPSGQPEEVIPLPRPVPVFMTYFTVQPGPDGVTFRPDRYGFDAEAMPQVFGGSKRIASNAPLAEVALAP